MNVLVTGATGYIGAALLRVLLEKEQFQVVGSVRKKPEEPVSGVFYVEIGDISGGTDWAAALVGVDVVIHLAGLAHVFGGDPCLREKKFRRVNVDGTLALAKQALDAGVKRFIFISSIGVNGDSSPGFAFSENSLANPHLDYSRSKYEAELGLKSFLADKDMGLVVIRPPMVYSSEAPGNFRRLLRLVRSGMPTPFANISNKRSLIAIENLVDFIVLCITHPAASDNLFLISDGKDVSTPEIVEYLALGMGGRSRLFSVPDFFLKWGMALIGKKMMYRQLCGSLVVDISKARRLMGWSPKVDTYQALIESGRAFLSSRQQKK